MTFVGKVLNGTIGKVRQSEVVKCECNSGLKTKKTQECSCAYHSLETSSFYTTVPRVSRNLSSVLHYFQENVTGGLGTALRHPLGIARTFRLGILKSTRSRKCDAEHMGFPDESKMIKRGRARNLST